MAVLDGGQGGPTGGSTCGQNRQAEWDALFLSVLSEHGGRGGGGVLGTLV